MTWTILAVDDEKVVHDIIRRSLDPKQFMLLDAYNGQEGLDMARRDKPDLILLDINMPELKGTKILAEIRKNIATRMIPVIFLTGCGGVDDLTRGFELGADDYVRKPFDLDELRARVQSALYRTKRNLSANPLTHLPGAPIIEEEVNRRIREKTPFSFFYIDIDNFKAYNDSYGYYQGDCVIRDLASFLIAAVSDFGTDDDMICHVGGDDFVLLTAPASAEAVAKSVIAHFDSKMPSYHSPEDRALGYITTKNRQGADCRFPLMSLSVAVATTVMRAFDHYGKVVNVASEIKKYLKTRPDRRGSLYLIDRRTDKPPA